MLLARAEFCGFKKTWTSEKGPFHPLTVWFSLLPFPFRFSSLSQLLFWQLKSKTQEVKYNKQHLTFQVTHKTPLVTAFLSLSLFLVLQPVDLHTGLELLGIKI